MCVCVVYVCVCVGGVLYMCVCGGCVREREMFVYVCVLHFNSLSLSITSIKRSMNQASNQISVLFFSFLSFPFLVGVGVVWRIPESN